MRQGLTTEVRTERGLESRQVMRYEDQDGRSVAIPELYPGEVMVLGSDGVVKVTNGRANRCAPCASWLEDQGVKCATLSRGGGCR